MKTKKNFKRKIGWVMNLIIDNMHMGMKYLIRYVFLMKL